MAWLDTGTPLGLLKASNFVSTIQSMQGFYISAIEEIAWRKGFINDEQLYNLGNELVQTDYGKYLISLIENKRQLEKIKNQ
jgi:glucose-1-phosphate thymidylyltransferase